MNILELRDVVYRYDKSNINVLDSLNASFEKGKIYCIVGKSGAGKTTLLSLLSGLDICCEGDVLYKGTTLTQLDRDKYRAQDIGVIFQSYNLLLNATAVDNIVLSMYISDVKEDHKKQTAYELLARLGLNKEKANRKILRLSGGEQQRVGIARAIAHNAEIVIADEPTGNLDPDTEDIIMNILRDLAHKEGKCVIIVTHSQRVSNYADEVWGINQGKLMYVTSK